MLCWLKPHSPSRLTSQAMQTKMSTQASPFPSVFAPAPGHNTSIYLFVNRQQISWLAWFSFSSPENTTVLHFPILFCFLRHPPSFSYHGLNQKFFWLEIFWRAILWPKLWALNMWRHREKRNSESQGQWCLAASTPPVAQGLISALFQNSL